MRVLKRILTLHDFPMHDCVTEEMHVLAAEDPTYKKWAEIIECLKQKSPPEPLIRSFIEEAINKTWIVDVEK